MKDRHMSSVANPRRRSRYAPKAADLTRSSGVGSLRVANEKRVSYVSDTRVTDGSASLAAMSRIAARASGQSGKR